MYSAWESGKFVVSEECMMERRQAAMSRDSASSDSDGRMCRFESGGVKSPVGDTKFAARGRVVRVLMGTSRLDKSAGTDFVV